MSDKIGKLSEGDVALIANMVARASHAEFEGATLHLTSFEVRALQVMGLAALSAEAGKDAQAEREEEWGRRVLSLRIVAEGCITDAAGRNTQKREDALNRFGKAVQDILIGGDGEEVAT
jgi:hypothetical protein